MANQIMSYYSTPANFDSPLHAICILINTYATDIGILDFQRTDNAVQWEKEYNDIKTTEEFVHMYIEANHMSLIEKDDVFATNFLLVTKAFLEKLGLEFVPANLRFSINDVHINIGIPLLSLPVTPYVDENCSLQTPNNTDDFGQGI